MTPGDDRAPAERAGGEARPAPLGPVGESERVVALDALRGFALLGILVVNMQFFAMPFMTALHPGRTLATGSVAGQASWAITRALFEYKFISLFSLLFGMGLVLQMNRAEAAGRPFAGLYLRRLAVLFVLGGTHAFGLWYGDILLIYSVLGAGLLLCRRLEPRHLLAAGAACLALAMTLTFLATAAGVLFEETELASSDAAGKAEPESQSEGRSAEGDAEASGVSPGTEHRESPRGLAAILASHGDPSDPRWIAAEIAAYKQGPALHAFVFRAVSYVYCLFAAAFGFGWRVLGLFLVGAALLKLGFFSPERRRWHVRLSVAGLALGLPLELAAVAIARSLEYELGWLSLADGLLHEAGSLLLCLGYAGSICLVVSSGVLAWLRHGLASVGRMALSNYLAQTLAATFVMYWWGFGQFNDVSRPRQLGLAFGLYLVLAVGSVLWMRFFTIGPAEWVWRSLTYGRAQPWRRRPLPPSKGTS